MSGVNNRKFEIVLRLSQVWQVHNIHAFVKRSSRMLLFGYQRKTFIPDTVSDLLHKLTTGCLWFSGRGWVLEDTLTPILSPWWV